MEIQHCNVAVSFSSLKTVQYLLTIKTLNVNLTNHDGDTALHLAIKLNKYNAFECIVGTAFDLDFYVENKQGSNVIALLEKRGHCPFKSCLCTQLFQISKIREIDFKNSAVNIEHIAYLVSKNVKNGASTNLTSLLCTARIPSNNCSTVSSQSLSVINYADKSGNSALYYAAHYNEVDIVKLLISKGADCNHVNKYGYTALMVAAEKGHEKCISLLLQAKADVHMTNNYLEESPLHLAAKNNHIQCIELLIVWGAGINNVTSYGHSPLMLASSIGHLDAVKVLLDKGAATHLTKFCR